MDSIEVTARFDEQGNATPLRFTWRGREYAVESTGRQWKDAEGQHVLVMVPGRRMFELLFAPVEVRWYLKQSSPDRNLA